MIISLLTLLSLLSLLSLTLSKEFIHSFIGRNKNLNLKLHFHDYGYKNATLLEEAKFRLKIYNDKTLSFIDSSTVHLHGRLISNTVIVPINIKYNVDSNDNKEYYYCNYTVYDIERYKLQLRISWLHGGLLDSLFDNYNSIKNVSNDVFLNFSKHYDEIVYDNGITLHNNDININNKLIKPNCTSGDISGRWVLIPEGKDCPNQWCIGNNDAINWLDDKINFNMGRFIFSPWQCNYIIYNREDIHQCFKNKGISKKKNITNIYENNNKNEV
jgi:hypothetical protein